MGSITGKTAPLKSFTEESNGEMFFLPCPFLGEFFVLLEALGEWFDLGDC